MVAADEVVWVSELESNSALIGKEIVVEGVFQGRVGANLDQIRLKKCNSEKIEFRLGPEVDRKFPSSLEFIRVTGTLTKSGNKLVLQIKSWARVKTNDEGRFSDVANRIGASDHRAWYKLADRTQRLAEFYDESGLVPLAQEARLKGFRAEEAALRPAQVAELLALAERATEVGLGQDESRRMRHKALRFGFGELKERRAAATQWSDLAERIGKLLPGAKTVLSPTDTAAVSLYNTKPVEFYESNPRTRDVCDRAFWIEATTESLLAAELTNPDFARLAADAKRLVPERPELARQLLTKWAEAEAARVPTLPPASQIIKLADTFRSDLNNPARADEVLRLWLDTRRGKLNPRDADGRVVLAKDYRKWLRDDSTAAKLLLEAIHIESDLPEAIELLKSLGYQKSANGWLRVGGDTANPTKTGSAASAARRLPEKGMTPEQVRSILGDPRPEDKLRLAAGKKIGQRVIVEQWTYRGPPDIHITFQIISQNEVRVTSINTQAQK